jgi:ribosomal protein S18 acetylase RimI-like enzyme
MGAEILEMVPADYDDVWALWRSAPGIGLSEADERGAIERYLLRNPGMSFVARADGRLAGAVLCGHDGRRGYLHHLAVDPAFRGRGLGRQLVARCLAGLHAAGVAKCHLFVRRSNPAAAGFWRRSGWEERIDIRMFSRSEPDPRGGTGAVMRDGTESRSS